MAIWHIAWPFGIFYGHLVLFVVILVRIFPRFGMLYRENLAALFSSELRAQRTPLTFSKLCLLFHSPSQLKTLR
jgi:hypothetical protein